MAPRLAGQSPPRQLLARPTGAARSLSASDALPASGLVAAPRLAAGRAPVASWCGIPVPDVEGVRYWPLLAVIDRGGDLRRHVWDLASLVAYVS